MKKIISVDIENYTIDRSNSFSIRNTARAIIFNKHKQIAFINATKYNYHVIPGGGIDDGETKEDALKRECLEETGLHIKIIREIGLTEEVQRYAHKIQNSFCYIAEVIGEAVEPKLEENELRAGYKLE